MENVYEYLYRSWDCKIRDFISSAGRLELAFRRLGLVGRWRIAREFAVYRYLKDGQK